VLLDLKMPRKNGLEVLEWIRGQPGLNALRVVVLTTSQEIRDVNQAYQLGANSFLVKPTDLHDFVAMTRALAGYWLWMSQMPESWRAPRKAVSGGLHPPGSTLSPQAVP
jgi:DNA-binding NarL/FixJ family response regulator